MNAIFRSESSLVSGVCYKSLVGAVKEAAWTLALRFKGDWARELVVCELLAICHTKAVSMTDALALAIRLVDAEQQLDPGHIGPTDCNASPSRGGAPSDVESILTDLRMIRNSYPVENSAK